MIHIIRNYEITDIELKEIHPFCYRILVNKPGNTLHNDMDAIIKCRNRVTDHKLIRDFKYPLTKW